VTPIEEIADVRFHRVLVAVDDSEPARSALAVALSLAKKFGATVVLSHVVSAVDVYTRAETADYDSNGSSLLQSAVEMAKARNIPYEARLLHGQPLEQLLQAITDAAADLIVMGTHARKGLARFYVGSVAEGVLRGTGIPVLVVRAPVAAEKSQDFV